VKPDNLLELGRVVDAYGLKGWVKVNPSSVDTVLVKLKTWWLEQPEGQFRVIEVSKPRLHGSTVVALPHGFEDRDHALALKGARIWASRSEFPKPLVDEFYWVDLVGCDVLDPDGKILGRVLGLQDHGAHPILEILPDTASSASAEPRLIPFVASIVRNVDLAARQIHVEWRADFFE
jgi:16S rRNA processing protein RimM